MKYAIVVIVLLLLNLALIVYPLVHTESYKPAEMKRVIVPAAKKKTNDNGDTQEEEKKRKVKEEMEKIRKRAASRK